LARGARRVSGGLMPAKKAASTGALPKDAVHPGSRAKWRAWFVTWKKSAGKTDVSYNDAVEEALCVGWVDSRPRALDAERTMLWFAPRKPKSAWAATNKARVARLIEAGLMLPAGQAAIDVAKANGSWSTLDTVELLEVPADLAAAFRACPGSHKHFDAFPKSVRRGILEWIAQAKRAETRAARVSETARLAQQNERANQWRPQPKGQ
jgi:uncharacterized protein YdeI (YjbR/CyaY-like superfamily)